MTSLGRVGLTLWLLLLLLLPNASLAATFVDVPATFGGAPIALRGLSGDGQVLVGDTLFPGPFAGVRWTQATGWQDLGAPPGNAYARMAAVSFDGSRAAGSGNVSGGDRWVQGSGWESLFSGDARAISDDGTVVAGDDQVVIIHPDTISFLNVWQEGAGNSGQLVASSPWQVYASAISGDGDLVIGNRLSILGHSNPMRFAGGGAGVEMPVVPAGTNDDCVEDFEDPCVARANAISANGGTVVGSIHLALSQPSHAARWQGDGAPTYLDAGPPDPSSAAHDVSATGRMIVGERDGAAFLWTAGGGMQDLKTLLEGLGIDLTGWTLARAAYISDDGSVIAGTGTRPGGAPAIWIAQAPELVPAAQVPALGVWGGAWLAIALLALSARAARSRR